MKSEEFFDKMDYNRNMKYDAGSVMRMMEAYHEARAKELPNQLLEAFKQGFGAAVDSLKGAYESVQTKTDS